MKSLAGKVLMVAPRNFISNPETAEDNYFQKEQTGFNFTQEQVNEEFSNLKNILTSHGIEVLVYNQTDQLNTPDAIFPNNWFSTHSDGRIILYPMKAENRRLERRQEIISQLSVYYPNRIDFSAFEKKDQYLEGTGSLVLDHRNKIAYAALSQRTNKSALEEWAKEMSFEPICFHAADQNKQAVYHTNVLLAIADSFAIICSASIPDDTERQTVLQSLHKYQGEILDISFDQMNHFCGNCLALQNKTGEHFLIMSSNAYHHFTTEQKTMMRKTCTLLHCDLEAIETLGGGGARCMLAELF